MPGKVWTRFTKNRNGKDLNFRIEELPQDKFEDVFNVFFKYYATEEPLHKASKVTQKAESFEEYKKGFTKVTKMLNYQVDACYLEDESGESRVVGGSIMTLEKRDEAPDEEALKALFESEEIKALFRLSAVLSEAFNIFEEFRFDSCYKGVGVVVHEDFRGLGIAGEILKMRSVICKERRVPMTCAWMTSVGTQKAAAKLGWETICELQFKDLGKQAGVEFEGGPSSCQLMIIKI